MKQLVRITPSHASGTVLLPPSKSEAHRALIAAALSRIPCRVYPIDCSADVEATIGALQSMGFSLEWMWREVVSGGTGKYQKPSGTVTVDCGESGSTLRFMLPLCAALGISATFIGRGRLADRPLDTLIDLLSSHGVKVEGQKLPLTLTGRLTGGVFRLPGNISSQYITGLMFALPLLEEDSRIQLTTPLESEGYIHMTVETLARAGIVLEPLWDGWGIRGGQRVEIQEIGVEGDWSQAAFFGIMGAVEGPVVMKGLRRNSLQGDRALADILKQFGAVIEQGEDTLTVRRGILKGIEIDAGQIPDLVPALAVLGCFAEGETRIVNAARLRLKESDRLATTCAGIAALGGKAAELPDGLCIQGTGLRGGRAKGANDHRIVMALAAGACFADAPSEIDDAQSIAKSYPGFFEDYKLVGGKSDVIDLD